MPDLDELEAKLSCNGYNVRSICELLNAKPSDVKSYLRGQLSGNKTLEFAQEINKLGII